MCGAFEIKRENENEDRSFKSVYSGLIIYVWEQNTSASYSFHTVKVTLKSTITRAKRKYFIAKFFHSPLSKQNNTSVFAI